MKQISDEPAPPGMVEPSVPPELESVVMRALAKRPSERYRTAGEFSRALSEARTALDGSGSTTSVMPAAGPATAETRVMDPVTGPTRVAPPPPDEPPGERRRRWPWIVAGIVLLAALAVAASSSSAAARPGGHDPSVAGQSAAEAQATLQNAGLGVEVQRVTNGDVEAGQAIDTDPPEGTEVDEGDTVVLRVSGGPGLAAVPNVEGDEEAAATAELQRADFEVDTRQEASSDVDEGVVISQSPDGGLAGRSRQHGDHRRVERARDRVGPGRPPAQPRQRRGDPERRRAGRGQRDRGAELELRCGHGHPPGPRADGPGPRGLAGRPGRRLGAGAGHGPVDRGQHGHRRADQAPERRLRRRNRGGRLGRAGRDGRQLRPAEGTQVDPGSTITISVSLGSSGGDPGSLGEGGGEGDQGTAPGAAARSRPAMRAP